MFDPFSAPKRKRVLTAADKKRIAAKQGWKCKKCKKPLPVRYHIDHIREFASGGSDRPSNLQALCPNCHADKTEMDRHKKRLKKIRAKEKKESGGLFGGPDLFSPPRRRKKSIEIFGTGNLFSAPTRKKRKKKKSAWDFS